MKISVLLHYSIDSLQPMLLEPTAEGDIFSRVLISLSVYLPELELLNALT